MCRRLTANAPALAVVAVVAPADFGAVGRRLAFRRCDAARRRGGRVAGAVAAGDHASAQLALEGTLKFGDLLLHPASYTGSLAGKDLNLTLTEFKLLTFLVQHAGRAFSRTRLMHEVWGYETNGRVRTVDVHVRRLRAKLGAEYESMVDTVRGVGYMAVTPPQPQWIISESAPSPVWTPPDSIAQ